MNVTGVQRDTWVVTGPQIIELDDVRALRVGLVAGRVDVVGRDEPGARIEVHRVVGRSLEVTLADGELRVGYPYTLGGWEGWLDRFKGWRADDRADVHIAVPRDVAARIGTVTAEGLLAEMTGGAQVSTVSGSVVADGTRGLLVAKSVSGDLVVRGHVGDLRANAVSGGVTASGRFGQVQVTTVSGTVTLDAAAARELYAQTVSGDVTVRLPEGLGVTVAAKSVSGRVVVDGEAHTGDGYVTGSVDVVRGDGAVRLSTKTVSGHVTVLRGGPGREGGAV
jgi:hypothetical protein